MYFILLVDNIDIRKYYRHVNVPITAKNFMFLYKEIKWFCFQLCCLSFLMHETSMFPLVGNLVTRLVSFSGNI